jgi:hypothetical protein
VTLLGWLTLMWRRPVPDDRCGVCRHFRGDAQTVEAMLPGLLSFGSGCASVRGTDGICLLRDILLSRNATCARFAAAEGAGPVRAITATDDGPHGSGAPA